MRIQIISLVDQSGQTNLDSADIFMLLTDQSILSCADSRNSMEIESLKLDFESKILIHDIGSTIAHFQRTLSNCNHFAGYVEQRNLALGTLLQGIGLLRLVKDVNPEGEHKFHRQLLYQPPRGMIFAGPAGVGKSRLMHALLKSIGCNFIGLPSTILLS
jgi:hypothetical protein